MDTRNPELAFAIGDQVTIAANGIVGKVDAVYIDRDCPQYNVEYADRNGAVFKCYFRAEDISAA